MSRLTEVRRRRAVGVLNRGKRRILWIDERPRLEQCLLTPPASMLDREKVVAVLKRRFPGSTMEQVAAAANAIVGLDDEWLEVPLPQGGPETLCRDGCQLKRLSRDGPVKLFRRQTYG